MASLNILCFNPFNLKNKIMKIEHKKIFRGPSKIFKNISWSINICLKYFMAPTKTLCLPILLHTECTVPYIRSFFAVKTGKEITCSDRYLNKTKQDSQEFKFLYYYKLYNIYLNVSR